MFLLLRRLSQLTLKNQNAVARQEMLRVILAVALVEKFLIRIDSIGLT